MTRYLHRSAFDAPCFSFCQPGKKSGNSARTNSARSLSSNKPYSYSGLSMIQDLATCFMKGGRQLIFIVCQMRLGIVWREEGCTRWGKVLKMKEGTQTQNSQMRCHRRSPTAQIGRSLISLA